MALGFGGLHKLYGIVTYKVSPMHLKAFHGVISHGFPNTIRRCVGQIPYIGPPFLACAGIYYGIEYLHHQTLLKQPGDYDDDE